MTNQRPLAVVDTECYVDYWLCKIRRIDTGAVRAFEQYADQRLDIVGLRDTLARVTSITFNGLKYDRPMIGAALSGASCETLKRVNDFIIQGRMMPWEAEKQFSFRMPESDHIDLFEVVPTDVSLKLLMARMHCPKLQDLPIEPDDRVGDRREILSRYNDNDLDGNEALYRKFIKQLDLRRSMSVEYGVDLRSKSDAQIAEAVIKSKLQALNVVVRKPTNVARMFKFRFPNFLQHGGTVIQSLIERIAAIDFVVTPSGKVTLPDAISKPIKIGRSIYRMGIGGLHSSEQSQSHRTDNEYIIIDRDVASYYPAIIIETGLYPKHLGKAFLSVYRSIFDRRMTAKEAGDKATSDTLKIVLNGLFGKLGNIFSIVYAPDLLLQVTLTGQLALLMLIERIEDQGIEVVSANTDGIAIKCPRHRIDDLNAVVGQWEQLTGFITEETIYRSLHIRDVNSYIAFKEDGTVKMKGAYALPEPVASSWPSPHFQICVTAACDYMLHDIPIALTIGICSDITQFIAARTVAGGAVWKGEYLGRVVRWYIASTGGEEIFYRRRDGKDARLMRELDDLFGDNASEFDSSDNFGRRRCALTANAKPLMFMDGTMPEDVDRDWYIARAEEIVREVGFARMDVQEVIDEY